MKEIMKGSFLLLALASCFGLLMAGKVSAQVFTVLHTFLPEPVAYPFTNTDGGNPTGPLLLSSNLLFGATWQGGNGGGTIFKINTDGTGYTVLHYFTLSSASTSLTNSDGSNPGGGLTLSGNKLYGSTLNGGTTGNGTIFAINPDGTGFTNLHSFTGNDGSEPYDELVISGNIMYGASGSGTIFAINTDGTGFTNLHGFGGSELPYGRLVLLNNTLYGVTFGGSGDFGTVFAVNTDGSGFTNLHYFAGGSEGKWPIGPLALLGNTLFGGTMNGGDFTNGTIFSINTDGTGFATLHSCSYETGSYPAGLMVANSVLFGIAAEGGPGRHGFIFEMNTDGTGFAPLHIFGDVEGAEAQAPLILSGNTFYGTAENGGSPGIGSGGIGTLFSFSLAPQLSLTPSGTNVVLSWPTNVAGFDYTGFTLQSSTDLGSSTNWSTISPAQAIISGQCVVTNPAASTQMFYRLAH